ncbi:MAG TPA: META domain-containing protein [Methylomirabilota bacterium]
MALGAGLVSGCRSADRPAAGASLIGTSWLAQEIDGRPVLERINPTLTFESAQRIVGNTACNRYFGGLELGDGVVKLKPTGTTRMACPTPVMEQERAFLAALNATTTFRREGDTLRLLDGAGRVRVRFTPLAPAR